MSTELKVEKNVPLPPRGHGSGRGPSATTLAALNMEAGDSAGDLSGTTAATITTAMREAGYKVAQRKQADGTYRVWRIA